jgi:two-component system CheB/CheR fusion protein
VIEQAWRERRSITLRDIEWATEDGEGSALGVSVAPLIDARGRPLSTSVTFVEITRYKEAQVELEQLNHELQTVTEELQSSNEELETTNEELQSTNEELETTNEELQSTNEELETMNEELQATNEELQTANEELVQRGEELDQSTASSRLYSGACEAPSWSSMRICASRYGARGQRTCGDFARKRRTARTS